MQVKLRLTTSRTLLLVVFITLLGTAFRLYRLNAVPLRGDEAFTVLHWMREPLSQTFANIVTVDPQGPVNYVLYRAYALVIGSQEQVVRFLPALLSVIGIPLLFALGHRLSGRRVGLLAALLWAVHPFAIWHAQDARSYAVWSVASPLALWLGLRALSHGRRLDWVLYVAAAVLSLYVYYLEVFPLAALSLWVVCLYCLGCTRRGVRAGNSSWRWLVDRPMVVRWIGAQVVVGLLVAPWYLQERLLSGGGYAGTSTGFSFERLWLEFLPMLYFGEAIPFEVLAPILALGVLLLTSLILLMSVRWRETALLLFLVVVPVVGLSFLSLRLSVFAPRYVLSVSVALVLLVALFVSRRFFYARGVFVVVFVLQLFAFYVYVYDYTKSPAWRELAAYVGERINPDDTIIQAAADEAFTFYCLEYALSSDCDAKLPANPRQSTDEIRDTLTMRSVESRGIWYVANPQASWPNAQDAISWLTENMQTVRSVRLDGLPAQYFVPWEVSPTEITPAPLATYEETAELVGLAAWFEPNHTLVAQLLWQPTTTTDMPLKVFVHLVDGSGIVAQSDQLPQAGRSSTDEWATGVVFRDLHTIPLTGSSAAVPNENTPDGYSLVIGFYDPVSGRRVPLADGADAYTIPLKSVLAR
ncbi:MAG: glycosyltransferase family 39 protein [Chloroflexi bacterium]|nr:glycosyltransferase family 39 protein [Chloroflexota bacterium]